MTSETPIPVEFSVDILTCIVLRGTDLGDIFQRASDWLAENVHNVFTVYGTTLDVHPETGGYTFRMFYRHKEPDHEISSKPHSRRNTHSAPQH